jgi:hypothetical protein
MSALVSSLDFAPSTTMLGAALLSRAPCELAPFVGVAVKAAAKLLRARKGASSSLQPDTRSRINW